MGTFVSTEHDGAVAVVTISNPPMNALSAALIAELEAEVERLDADEGTRAIVLRGGGERAFVAGADITEFPTLRETVSQEGGSARGIQRLGARMDASGTPFVAAIHGYCLGGGLELAMCCDVRVASEDAQLGQPEIKLGLIPGGGGTQRLPRLVGPGRAMLMNLGGDFVPAATAEQWGLVEQVVPREELLEAAVAIAQSFAARSPHAIAVLRELARTTRDLPLEEGLRREADGFARCLRSEDGQEGVAAFIEKREPRFTGGADGVKAVVLARTGGPEELAVADLPEPEPGDGQVVVEVRATAINFLEILVRRGLYPQMPELPWVPGVEVAGEVDGRRVVGLVRGSGGGYAERTVVDEDWLFDLPEHASFEDGAAFLMAFLTAWIPLTQQAPLRPGSRVLIHAAAGGVGSAAVELARCLGAEVVATAGSEEKLELPRSLGAAQAVTYERLGEIEPVDVVFDPVGGQLFADSLALLKPLGVAVAIGFAGGQWQPVDPAQIVGRNVSVAGFYLGRLMRFRPDVVRRAAEDLLRMWGAGLVTPVVGATFALEDVADAHRLVEERRSTGKVVLVP